MKPVIKTRLGHETEPSGELPANTRIHFYLPDGGDQNKVEVFFNSNGELEVYAARPLMLTMRHSNSMIIEMRKF